MKSFFCCVCQQVTESGEGATIGVDLTAGPLSSHRRCSQSANHTAATQLVHTRGEDTSTERQNGGNRRDVQVTLKVVKMVPGARWAGPIHLLGQKKTNVSKV